jgi:hypothetical protein
MHLELEVNTFSIVMELMPLGTLRSNIQKKKLESWASRKLGKICEGGAFLHSSTYSDDRPNNQGSKNDARNSRIQITLFRQPWSHTVKSRNNITEPITRSLKACLKTSLDNDPKNRTSFQEMFDVLTAADKFNFGSNEIRDVRMGWKFME